MPLGLEADAAVGPVWEAEDILELEREAEAVWDLARETEAAVGLT